MDIYKKKNRIIMILLCLLILLFVISIIQSQKANAVGVGSKGIDVSVYQGDIDFGQVKSSGIEYVMIRDGWGYSGDGAVDKKFTANYEKAKAVGLPVGAYHFSYASSADEARREAEYCLSILGGRQFDLPIAFDAESNQLSIQSRDQITDCIVAFCDTIKAAGYQPMVYASRSWFDSKIDYSRISGYRKWVAEWRYDYNLAPRMSNDYDMWQYSDKGTVSGISGAVDLDKSNANFISGINPTANVDSATGDTGRVNVEGWAFDKDDSNASIYVDVYIGGPAGQGEGHRITADGSRDDVNNAYGIGGKHGFASTLYTLKSGNQDVYFYAINIGSGENIEFDHRTVNIPADTEKPTISDVNIYNVTNDGYTVSCKAKDNIAIDRVEFPAWTAKKDASGNEQDDLQSPWPRGSQSGDTYTFRVKRSEHNNESGIYRTHIYAFDLAGNACGIPVTDINSRAVYQPAKVIEKEGHLYAIYNDAFNRNDAKAKAESFGGHLATITSDSEQSVVDELIKGDSDAQYNSSYWLGGYKEGTTWKWDTGENLSYSHWCPGQPDGGGRLGSNPDGLAVFTGENFGKWDDDNSNVSYGFIVEFENISAGSSVTFNGKKYTRFDIGLPWEVAQVYCQSQGGQLATVNSSDIQKKIAELANGGKSYYFLGASDTSGSWKWSDGSTVDYNNWATGEPNNYNGIESYAEISGGDKWNDISGSFESQQSKDTGFVCETSATEVTQISLNKIQIALAEGGTDTITATVSPDNAENKTITWSSANPDVATVDESGKITAVSKGITVITATSSNGKQATCTVTVNGAEDTSALKVVGTCSPTKVKPGGVTTITVNLKNYDVSAKNIASMQIEVPGTTNQLTYVANSRTSIIADGEFSDSTDGNTIFSYLPFNEGDNILAKDTTGLFSFQVKISDKITADTDVQLPIKVTIGDENDNVITQNEIVNVTVAVRMKVIKKGDLNNDGSVDIMDARKAKRAAMKSVVLTADELEAADLDGDGTVNIIEARKIKRAAMKVIVLE